MYKTIAIYETKLQKKIICHFISEGVISENGLLIIDAIGHKVKLMDRTIDLNFNKFSNIFNSLKNTNELKELNLECETLVSTHFTGINALFFSSFIKCKQKMLIDDGIGTPVLLLDNSLYNRLFRFQGRFFFIKFALRLLYNIKLLTVQKATLDFSSYYSIYQFENFFSNNSYEFRYIEGVNKKYEFITKGIGFIGSPMTEFGLVSEKKYKTFLSTIVNKEGPFTYFLHPDEKNTLNYQIDGVNFVKTNMFIEEYFEKHGVPETLYSFSSSASLNIAAANPKVKIFNIGYESFFRNKNKIYHQVLNELGIKKSTYTVN